MTKISLNHSTRAKWREMYTKGLTRLSLDQMDLVHEALTTADSVITGYINQPRADVETTLLLTCIQDDLILLREAFAKHVPEMAPASPAEETAQACILLRKYMEDPADDYADKIAALAETLKHRRATTSTQEAA